MSLTTWRSHQDDSIRLVLVVIRALTDGTARHQGMRHLPTGALGVSITDTGAGAYIPKTELGVCMQGNGPFRMANIVVFLLGQARFQQTKRDVGL